MIPERIGPMQGDQPAAKPIPTSPEANSERFALRSWSRLSIMSAGILNSPIMFRPSTITTTPPSRAIQSLY